MTDAPAQAPADGRAGPGRGAVEGPDGRLRCPWGLSAPDYVAYHDLEWGRPVRGDRLIYERLTLEAFQSGLSWLTILRKRENFRRAFADFDLEAVAAFGEDDVARLLGGAGIIRNRANVPPQPPASNQLAKELRARGFVFTGPVTVYAAMQACGLVNDHLAAC